MMRPYHKFMQVFEAQGGRIKVEPNVDEGTTFTIIYPAASS